MASKRLDDLAAAKAQLKAMDDLEQAKNELIGLTKKLSHPKGLVDVTSSLPSSKEKIKAEYLKEKASYEKTLEWETKVSKDPSLMRNPAPFGLGALIGLILGAAGFFIASLLLSTIYSAIIAVVVFFVTLFAIPGIFIAKENKKILEQAHRRIKLFSDHLEEIKAKYLDDISKAEEADANARKQAENTNRDIRSAISKEYAPKIEIKKKEIAELEAKYKEVAVLPTFIYSDRKELTEIISALEKNHAESIFEARSLLKKEKEQIAEAAKKKKVFSEKYNGKLWDLTNFVPIPQNITALERDTEALFYSFGFFSPANQHSVLIENWFSLIALRSFNAAVTQNSGEWAICQNVWDTLKKTGSWKLQILSLALLSLPMNCLKDAWNKGIRTDLNQAIKDAQIRGPENEDENEYLSTLNRGMTYAEHYIIKYTTGKAPEMPGFPNSSFASSSYNSSTTSQSTYQASSYHSGSKTVEEKPQRVGQGSYSISDADYKIYIVKNSYEADKKVYFENSAWYADRKVWIVDHSWDADAKVYVTNSAWEADEKVFPING